MQSPRKRDPRGSTAVGSPGLVLFLERCRTGSEPMRVTRLARCRRDPRACTGGGDHQVLPGHPGAREQHAGGPRSASRGRVTTSRIGTRSRRRERALADGLDDVSRLAQRRRHVLDDDVGAAGEGAVHLPGVRLVRADRDDDGVVAHAASRRTAARGRWSRRRRRRPSATASRPRLGGRARAASRAVERRHGRVGVAAHEVGDPGQRPAPAQRGGSVATCATACGPAPNTASRERRVVAPPAPAGPRRPTRPACAGWSAPCRRAGRAGARVAAVEQQVDALDPGQPERRVAGRDRHELDAGRVRRRPTA